MQESDHVVLIFCDFPLMGVTVMLVSLAESMRDPAINKDNLISGYGASAPAFLGASVHSFL